MRGEAQQRKESGDQKAGGMGFIKLPFNTAKVS
jgi:hypothetical protein